MSLEPSEMNASLLTAPKMLKDFVNQFRHKKEIQDLQECMEEERSKQSSKFKSFLNSFLADVLLFFGNIVNNNCVISSYICGMWTIIIKNSNSKHSPTAYPREQRQQTQDSKM